jgi:hypothetical protein
LDHISSPWDTEMNIKATKWSYLKMLDIVFLWATIWALPCATYVAYNTIFHGPAILQPTPEGYEPEEHEYER